MKMGSLGTNECPLYRHAHLMIITCSLGQKHAVFCTQYKWKVVTKFHSNPQQSYSAEFEVKEYVLPSFEVKLMPVSPFFYVDSDALTINIKATYLFGEEVDGTAYVVFGVMQDGQKRSFPGSFQRVQRQWQVQF
ncbi:complement C3-like [Sebastes umbrosus]|uniref:complement C3-like n=1 Tax=Sebastes umbrosus TaxID=72105 RepID=UPI00189CC956|nr:complement C3-like [Sebastes umbrosus]